jgi:hypothetical protein
LTVCYHACAANEIRIWGQENAKIAKDAKCAKKGKVRKSVLSLGRFLTQRHGGAKARRRQRGRETTTQSCLLHQNPLFNLVLYLSAPLRLRASALRIF